MKIDDGYAWLDNVFDPPRANAPKWTLLYVVVAFLALLIAGIVTASAEGVGPNTPKDTTHCDAPKDITSTYNRANVTAFVYHFTGADALTIAAALTDAFGAILNGSEATEVYIAVEAASDPVAEMFLYGADGCFVAYIDSLDGAGPIAPTDMAHFLNDIGLVAPFGGTFHQDPYAPGSNPGFAVGGIRA